MAAVRSGFPVIFDPAFLGWTNSSHFLPFKYRSSQPSNHNKLLVSSIFVVFTMALLQSPSVVPLSSRPENSPIVRRTGNYHPTMWDDGFIESFTPYLAGSEKVSVGERIDELKEKTKCMLSHATQQLQRLNLVDTIDRLGIRYHFYKETEEILKLSYNEAAVDDDDLHAVALRFRLLRQDGYYVSCSVFEAFKDKEGKFKQSLRNDVRGLLSLYEASHHGIQGEDILDEAMAFTTKHLSDIIIHLDPSLARHVEHSLELPLLRRMPRLETRYYISFYEKDKMKNDILLELAKLDFNLVQSLHQSEIKDILRWWKDLEIITKFPFARDRVVECYIWGVDINFLPQFSVGRKALGKYINLISLLDDTYDTYGTLDELEIFTDAIDRWDLGAMDKLPEYMKLLYLAIYNLINEMEYISLRQRGKSAIYYLRKILGDLCKAYLQEARWYNEGYVPTLEEYLNIATTSAAGFVIMLVAAVNMGDMVSDEGLDYIVKRSKIPWLSSAISRFTNDLGTSKDEQERGDVANSIQCYMKEHGVSEDEARVGIMKLNARAWKDINQELLKHIPLPKQVIKGILNFGRSSEMYYQNGNDGHGNSKYWTRDRINSLFFEAIRM